MTTKKPVGAAKALAPNSDTGPAARLQQLVSANPKAPTHWLMLAAGLASHPDMAWVWARLLPRNGDVTLLVLDAVRQAFEQAAKEVPRQTSKEEAQQLETVKRLARELKLAIERSPLPRNTAAMHELKPARRLPSVMLSIGWRDLDQSAHPFHTLAFTDMMDMAVEMVDQHISALPPRSLTRQRNKGKPPFLRSFVRWLAWHLTGMVDGASNQVLARIAMASLALEEPLSEDDVKTILKDQPAPFRVPKRPSRAP